MIDVSLSITLLYIKGDIMGISIFLSYPKPHLKSQDKFVNNLTSYLQSRGIQAKTLGVTEYDMDAPLKAIRRLMLESNGLITVAFRRTLIENGIIKANADINEKQSEVIRNCWLTSPYCQIEPAMAYQIGLPILILRETGVYPEALLEKGVVGNYMPEFSLENNDSNYLQSKEWNSIIGKWESLVRSVVDAKGNPPKLY